MDAQNDKKARKAQSGSIMWSSSSFFQNKKTKKELSTLSRKKWKNTYKKIGDDFTWSGATNSH